MIRKGKLAALCVAAAVAGVIALGTPATAFAATHTATAKSPVQAAIVHPAGAPSRCSAGHFCAWRGTNGGGTECYWSDSQDSTNWQTDIGLGEACYRQVLSLYNNGTNGSCSNKAVYIYQKAFWDGGYDIIKQGSYYLNMSGNSFKYGSGAGVNEANNVLSNKWGSSC